MSFDDIQQHEDEAGITRSQQYVHSLIAKERIVLGGFSQGGAMSLISGVTAPTRLGGIFGLSCYLLLRGKLRDMVPSESPNKVSTTPRIEIENLTLHIYIMLI
jgi:predicted esterase